MSGRSLSRDCKRDNYGNVKRDYKKHDEQSPGDDGSSPP